MPGKIKLDDKYLEKSLRLLERATTLLEKYNIPYWLEGGTLLGIIRENRLLPWDNDLDISIRSEDFDRLRRILPKFFYQGMIAKVRGHKIDDPPFQKGEVRLIKVYATKYLFFKTPLVLDIFVKKKLDDQYYWVVGVKRRAKKAVPARFYDELTTVQFNNKTYSIPKLTDEYLTYRYGDWRTPVKTWNYIKDDQSIVSVSKITTQRTTD
ncbi:MAG TPA: LicD family protein [Candidatus Marinimicrobia bacterium]|nr:LicD family protein [Candidatus Neomarinimicrobiota bacterium]HQE96316.1 LicD family protein [Candidatus Neomarinimicrobiota bacterium]HQH54934.1 LicD family protein [Candidatus Neomarinimicrobiota bacterium]HQK10652.1 LicD family protein [Candidatus Neomarinimicrobiota bacterium]HRU45820.1 LicD family protein [Candidatus Neomarinimicrobiota bacterium]